MGRIVLVRHGQASLLDDDYDRLSPLGVRQSEAVGAWLAPRFPVPAMMASGTLERQRGSAVACQRAAGWPAGVLYSDADFNEYTHEDLFSCLGSQWSNPATMAAHLRAAEHPRRTFHALFERALDAWLAGTPGSGVTWPQFRARCGAALARVVARLGSGDVAVIVSSGGAIAAMLQPLLGVPDAQVPTLHTPLFNASISQLLTRGNTIALSSFNSVAHLELSTEPPTLVTYR